MDNAIATVDMDCPDEVHVCTLAEWCAANEDDPESCAAVRALQAGESDVVGCGFVVWCLGSESVARAMSPAACELLAQLAAEPSPKPWLSTREDDPEQPSAFGVWVGPCTDDECPDLVGAGDSAADALADAIGAMDVHA